MSSTRLIIVTDIHHGAVSFTKQGPQALALLDAPLMAAREAEALIDLGDRISDVDAATDKQLQTEVAARLAEAPCPVHAVNGNHDRAFLSEADNDLILGRPTGHRVVDFGSFRAVFFQPDVTLTPTRPLRMADGDLDALERMLGASDKRALLFSHVPLALPAAVGAFWFDNNHAFAHYQASAAAIRHVIALAPCPVVAIAGHVHVNTAVTVDGTPHLTQQSLSDSWATGETLASGEPAASGAYATLEVMADRVSWRVHGLDPIACEVAFPRLRRRWPAPLPPFHTLRGVAAEAPAG